VNLQQQKTAAAALCADCRLYASLMILRSGLVLSCAIVVLYELLMK
jgi:hypothetical protein